MNSPFEITFWLYFLYFIAAVFVTFYIPGFTFVQKIKLNRFNETVLSIVLGLVLFSLQGFIFGYLNLRFVTYVYILFFLALFIRKKSDFRSIFHFKLSKPDYLIVLIIGLGTLVQLSSVWLNGIKFSGGLYFCCGVPDTLTHLALSSELVRQFPPNEPGFSGIPLYNYHYFSNLIIADLVRVFFLPIISTSYQFMTVLLSLLLGLSAVVFSNTLEMGKEFKRWLVFLLYFTGDIIFLLPFLFGKGVNFTLTTLENSSSLWISPPRFYSIVVFFAGLSMFVLWLKKKDLFSGILMAIMFGSSIGFKVYVGVIVLSGLLVLGIKYALQKKLRLLLPIVLTFILSLIIYLPINSGSGGVSFSGFWRFEDFIVQPSLGLSNLELARRVFLEHHNLIRALIYDLFFGFLYIFFSSGVLVLGLLQTKKSLRKFPFDFNLLVITGLVISCALGFFFLQATGGANSSQFLISIYVIGALYTALAISYWIGKFKMKKISVMIVIFLVLLTSTRVIHDTFIRIDNISNMQGAFVSNQLLDSYQYLDSVKDDKNVIVLDAASLDCLFMPIIGNKSTYYCTSGLPGVISEDTLKKRNDIKNEILFGKSSQRERLILANEIGYIFLSKGDANQSKINTSGFSKVYENNSVTIFKQN